MNDVALLARERHYVWIRNRRLHAWSPPKNCAGYIEFVGGDRIVGSIVGARASRETDGEHTPAHLLVKPATQLRLSSSDQTSDFLRIRPERIRKVVFRSASNQCFQGGSLFYLSGRRVGFVSLLWRRDSVVLLLTSGTRTVKLSDIAEIHLPRVDPWRAYYSELAVLSPDCRSRIVRIETADGLIATTSEMRFDAVPFASEAHRRQMIEHRKRIDASVSRAAAEHRTAETKLRDAHDDYDRRSAALKEEIKRTRDAYEKAKSTIRKRVDKDRKSDSARLAEKRNKLDGGYRSALAALEKRVARLREKQRNELLKQFHIRQDQQRKRREQSLARTAERYRQQRQREFQQALKTETHKHNLQEANLLKRSNQLRTVLEEETRRCEQHATYLEQIKLQQASSPGPDGSPETWCHMVQPVWSLDAIWTRFDRIRMRSSLPPTHVPLSRIPPSAAVSPLLLPWRLNRNSASQALCSGGRQYSWGFGVHAYSELCFMLPPEARAFRTRLGLDSTVGKGGCVRARVFAGSLDSKPLYRSPLILGSEKTVDTGVVAIRPGPHRSLRLILQVDPVNRNAPPGADPLNVRDKFDWLDPRIELDQAGVHAAVRRQLLKETFAWNDWDISFDKEGRYIWSSFYDKTVGRGRGGFLPLISAENRPLVLSRTLTIGTEDNWLVVGASSLRKGVLGVQTVKVRVDGKEISPESTPSRQQWRDRDPPAMFALNRYKGEKVTIELTQTPDGNPVFWKVARVVEDPPAAYRLASILKNAGKGGRQVPRGLGWAIRSEGGGKVRGLALLNVHEFGGVVNFEAYGHDKISPDELSNVLIGGDWTGDDETLITNVSKLEGLGTLFVTGDSKASIGAIDKIQTAMPGLNIVRFDRTPSPVSAPCFITMHNRTGKDVNVLWIGYQGRLRHPRTVRPDERRKQRTHVGGRYEAYLDGKLVSRYVAVPDQVWAITADGMKGGR
ncbi:MAG: NPCBM/NEW2 domain-containing protein [Phycisphaerae bacterium]|nr:NPCBM/NEW2 domain-containing protein [Phycisphaerae bacterium]